MKPFREVRADNLDSVGLKKEMETHGYVMVRSLLASKDLNALLRDISEILRDAGWLNPASNPIERISSVDAPCVYDDPRYKVIRDKVFGLQSFHAFPHQPLLQTVMKLLVGEQLLIHPKSEARLVFPNFEPGIIHAHQDHTAVGGDENSFTAWIPLHDCPVAQGPLRILDNSHRLGLLPTVDDTGFISLDAERGSDWVGGDINAGDVLLFHSLTVHEAAPNRSNRLRVSVDCRFQSYERAVNPATLVFTGRRSWKSTYADWTSDELKYYWTKLPLHLKPSKLELAELAETAESPEIRARCARILERLDL